MRQALNFAFPKFVNNSITEAVNFTFVGMEREAEIHLPGTSSYLNCFQWFG